MPCMNALDQDDVKIKESSLWSLQAMFPDQGLLLPRKRGIFLLIIHLQASYGWTSDLLHPPTMITKPSSCLSAAAKSLQSCPTLCDTIDVSPPGSPAPGILQARTLEWVAISFSNASKWKSESEVAQSCPTLRDLRVREWENVMKIFTILVQTKRIYLLNESESEVAQSCPTLCDSL